MMRKKRMSSASTSIFNPLAHLHIRLLPLSACEEEENLRLRRRSISIFSRSQQRHRCWFCKQRCYVYLCP